MSLNTYIILLVRAVQKKMAPNVRKYGRVEGVFPTGWSRFLINENVSSEYDVHQEDVRKT